MLKGKLCVCVCVWMVCAFIAERAEAFIVINEVLADPPAGAIGDANKDGIRSFRDDEFIELLNTTGARQAVSGWRISDGAADLHVFPSGSLLDPYGFIAVFGGGRPDLPGINTQIASSGGLNLSNSGETILLLDDGMRIVDEFSFGREGGEDRSLVRGEEGFSGWIVAFEPQEGNSDLRFTPGTSGIGELTWKEKDVQPPQDQTVVPEPASLLSLACGLAWCVLKKSHAG